MPAHNGMEHSRLYADPKVLFLRLLRRCVRNKETGCWVFGGSVNSRGYGVVGSGKSHTTITGHRLALLARDGEIPEGMTVDHACHDRATCAGGKTCPHRRCVNPAHLRVMSTQDNSHRNFGFPLTAKAPA